MRIGNRLAFRVINRCTINFVFFCSVLSLFGSMGWIATAASIETGVIDNGSGGARATSAAPAMIVQAGQSPRPVWVWGNNQYGQQGNGTIGTGSLTPVPMSGLNGIISVSCGYFFSLALRDDRTVWSWGSNNYGQLGDGTSGMNRLAPAHVVGPGGTGYLSGIISICGGFYHSLALKSDGSVWAWGKNDCGQIGDGTSGINRLTPVQVKGLSGITAIASGAFHCLALRNDGTVWAWGRNLYGAVGDGTSGANIVTPVQVAGPGGTGYMSKIISISAGYDHSLALKNDGTAWAWGRNDYGPLGDGTIGTDRLTPVQVSGLSGVVTIAGGGAHSLAVKSDGTVWAWGFNNSGQIGDGTFGGNRLTPVQVVGQWGGGYLTGVIAIAGGDWFSMARKSDGTLWTWGNNDGGQLGDGTSGINRRAPVPVNGMGGVIAISGGHAHSLILADTLPIRTAASTAWLGIQP